MPRISIKHIMKKNQALKNKNQALKKENKTLKKENKTLKKESEKHKETKSNNSEYMSADGISSLSEGSVTGKIVPEVPNRANADDTTDDTTNVNHQGTPTTSDSDTLTDEHHWEIKSGSRSRSTGGTRKRHRTRSASRRR